MRQKEVRFPKSAQKHRIVKAHVLFVLESCEPITVFPSDGEDQKLLWIGYDNRGVELEVVAFRGRR